MTTATGKPVSADESANALLGSIVREHLERAAGSKSDRTDVAQEMTPQEVIEHPAEDAAAVGATERADLIDQASDPEGVKKEFDALFAGDVGAAQAPAQVPARSQVTETGEDESRLSREELDALLASGDKVDEPSAEKALAEAEGVLTEELAQLMAAPEVKVDRPAAAAAVAAAPVAAAMPVVDPASMPPVVVIEAPEVEAEPEVTARPRGRVLHDLGLMAGQLVDLPFSWIPEVEKNLLGIAAFLLLLGGAVLWILSWMTR